MVTKRPSNPVLPELTGKSARRLPPTSTTITSFALTNLDEGETVHQACLLVTGQCPTYENSADDYVSANCQSSLCFRAAVQNWPVVGGAWKALVMLNCGTNELTFELRHAGGVSSTIQVNVHYQPLLQLPPLHLAILVAKDSPLVIDCPPAKYGAFTSAHSSLDATIAKFRTTALMWQAFTAEDMRGKGLGRRAFRLEEEWTANNLTFEGISSKGTGITPMASIPKVHLIRSEKTTAELRDANIAQQNERAQYRDRLHHFFTKALEAHGAPFDSSCRPVVAGLILDSHYSVDQHLTLGHAALGCHKASGISLGIFGSHTTYAWPRFMDEIPSCLMDSTVPGDTVANDNNECNTMAQACFVGQGAFLHEVGHAFGAGHTTGIMARGYSHDWGNAFLGNSKPEHEAKFHLQDALRFRCEPHFRLPGDDEQIPTYSETGVSIILDADDFGEDALKMSSSIGLANVKITNGTISQDVNLMVMRMQHKICSQGPGICMEYRITDLAKYDRSKPLEISALAMSGKHRVVKDAWKLFAIRSYITLPGTAIRLRKRAIRSAEMTSDNWNPDEHVEWSVLLCKKSTSGEIIPATSIDLRVGCTFDGAVVYYGDGSHANCGPSHDEDGEAYFISGGHASERHDLPEKGRITKVEIGGSDGRGRLDGIRMTLDDGTAWGKLNAGSRRGSRRGVIQTLEPDEGENIVGFYGTSGKANYDHTKEFGIITAPKDFKLPNVLYDMPELQNFDGRKQAVVDGGDSNGNTETQSTIS